MFSLYTTDFYSYVIKEILFALNSIKGDQDSLKYTQWKSSGLTVVKTVSGFNVIWMTDEFYILTNLTLDWEGKMFDSDPLTEKDITISMIHITPKIKW